ncbi:armadillo-type protein [Pseudoneurospora amorphoporcata]|uniref:Armadillo-type protein n=1 Tax=Pseudoneurospora amorphoporcata TaxID=241081 RepID=A0AAN6NXN4_9PEZI|nr:armadillo-type protein [Pseudoneurospora amorphoporcata]
MTPWKLPSIAGRSVGILGAGVLGRRIGACWASAGYKVHIRDPDPQQTNAALQYITNELWRYKPIVDPNTLSVHGFQDMKPAVEDSWLVIECVPERLDMKIDVFAKLEGVTQPDAILASNSSSYKSREMTAKVKPETAQRMLNTHYFVPPAIRIVELMTSGSTRQEIFPFLSEHFKASGMMPVIAHKESTGFILNRVWAAIKRECLMVLADGVASPKELDAVWTEMFIKNGSPPCTLMDSVGLDTVSLIEKHYIQERGLQDRGVLPFLQKYIDEGKLGAKSSKGGLYPPGHTVKTANQEQTSNDNLHAPFLYFLDIGWNNDPDDVEFSRKGRILVGSADGRSPLKVIVDHLPMPDGIALSQKAGKIFWTNMGTPGQNDGSIMSCNLDGSGVRVIIPPGAVHTPKQLSVDQDNEMLYFSDREGMRVFRCGVDGSNLQTLVRAGDWRKGIDDPTSWCVGITVSAREGKFYWTQKGPPKGSQGRIYRASIRMPEGYDASNRPDIEVVFDHLPEPIDLEMDEDGSALYWTDRGELPNGNSLNRATLNPDGSFSNHQVLARNLHEAIGLAIDKTTRHIYATDLGGAVYRFNVDGSGKQKFYEDQGAFTGIALLEQVDPSSSFFAIEVAGEAAPLNLLELARTLEYAALSTDHAQRQSAGQQLQSWESRPDYHVSLQTVFLDKSINNSVRFLAVILLKNGIDKYWRHTAKHAIQPAEKQFIRSRLLQGSVGEEDRNLALHNALVIAKIVRIDYPNDWPDVIPSIISVTRSARTESALALSGALQVLLRVVKELATARLRRSQTALQAVTPELVQLLGEIYTERTAAWQQFFARGGSGDEDEADYYMQNSLTALKILRRLVTVGYEHPHTDPMVQGFWSLSQSQFDQFLTGVSSESHIPAPFQDSVGKHLIQFTKLHIDMCDSHPASFPLLPNSIPLVKAYWNLVKQFSNEFEKSGGIRQTGSENHDGSAKHEGPLSEKLALKGLLLLRSCVSIAHRPMQTFKYKSPEVKNQEKEATELVKDQLLTNNFLLDIVQVTISRLFIFRQSDLEAWEEDPEEWEAAERNEGQAYEWAVRPCAERLLIDLLTHYKELGQPLLTYCEFATKVDMDIVTKEAAYCALGCAAAVIHEAFDFDRFLKTTLVKDAQIQDSMSKLLRRRIAILLNQWISIRTAEESRPAVYEIFRHLMNPDDPHNDQVVRITAAREFKGIVDDFGFQGEQFLPFAPDIFNQLMALLQEVASDETKLTVLDTIRAIVQRMETHISQFGDAIMLTLPKLWESAEKEEYMIKQSILAIMSALVDSMRGDSQRYQPAIIPLLREAMEPESALHLHLIEESVALWKSVTTQSYPPLHPDLVQMVELALPLLEYDSEVANQCLELVKNYILLAPREILDDRLRRPTLAALVKTLDARSREQSQTGAKSIELVLRIAEDIGGVQGLQVVVQDMLEIGLLNTIFEGLHSAWEASTTHGPNKKVSQINTIKQTDYFMLLARIALGDPTVFLTMLAGIASNAGSTIEQVWEWLGTLWFNNFDCMAEVERQKLSLLALTRLWELPDPMVQEKIVLARLQDFLAMWTSVVTELAASDDDQSLTTDQQGQDFRQSINSASGREQQQLPSGNNSKDYLVWDPNSLPSYEWDTPLDVTERQFSLKDPVHRVEAYEFTRERLAGLVQRMGGEQRFEAEWAVNVDKDVLEGFRRLGDGR